MVEIRHIAEIGPELDFLALASIQGEDGNVRDRVSRWMRSGLIIGIVPGIYVTANEFRKRPVSLEILANMISGPSYVSFEYVLARNGLIPEGVWGITSATPKRNRDFDTPLGRFRYLHLPLEAYSFGWTREQLPDGAGYLIARPEKALLDCLYRGGAVRSAVGMEERLFEDLRIDPDTFGDLDHARLADYASRMPGATFTVHLMKMMGRSHA
jgi:hypothetical protein